MNTEDLKELWNDCRKLNEDFYGKQFLRMAWIGVLSFFACIALFAIIPFL